jgi:hypothetical protein
VVASVLAGVGVSSFCAFAWLLAGGVLDRGYAAAEAAVCATVAVAARRSRSRAPGTEVARDDLAGLLAVGIVLAGCAAALCVVMSTRRHGWWDAWTIWNLRARFLFRGGPEWRRAFAPAMPKAGYPLLLPLTVARAWAYGGESLFAPQLAAAVFTLAAPIVLFAAVARSARTLVAGVAALVLLATPEWIDLGSNQCADVPLATLFVAGLGLLASAGTAEGTLRSLRLAAAGLVLGLGAWTKNEGVAAGAAALVAYLAVGLRARAPRALRDLKSIAAGAAAPVAAWLALHAMVVPSVTNDFTEFGDPGALAKVLGADRWTEVGAGILEHFPGAHGPLLPTTLVLAVALGVRTRALARSVPFVASVLLLLAYALAYVLSVRSIRWHLEMSASRVLIQAWPALLLGIFAAAAPPALDPGAKPVGPGATTGRKNVFGEEAPSQG